MRERIASVPDRCLPGLRWLGGMLTLLALAARGEAPLPAEFWEYLLEYGDNRGGLFDPGDLALTAQLRSAAAREKPGGSGQPDTRPDVEPHREIDPAATDTREPIR